MSDVVVPARISAELAVEAEPRLLKTAVIRAQLLRCALRGLNAKQAAAVVKCSHSVALSAYSDPGFRESAMKQLNAAFEGVDAGFVEKKESWFDRLDRAADKAFEELMGMLERDNLDDAHRIKICQDFLDRTPETASQSAEHRYAHFNAEELALAARTAEEMNQALVAMRRLRDESAPVASSDAATV